MTDRSEADPVTGSASVVVWLIRHGETEWSREGRHTGRTDIALTPAGERQAEALRATVARINPVAVLCSPRTRAQQTAKLAGLHVDETVEDLAEWDYGTYEGITTAEIRRTAPGWTVFDGPVPGGETAEQVGARADRVLAAAEHLALERGGPVVLVAHGHICRVIGARWIGMPVAAGAHLALDTAAVCELGSQHDVRVLNRWNVANPAVQEAP